MRTNHMILQKKVVYHRDEVVCRQSRKRQAQDPIKRRIVKHIANLGSNFTKSLPLNLHRCRHTCCSTHGCRQGRIVSVSPLRRSVKGKYILAQESGDVPCAKLDVDVITDCPVRAAQSLVEWMRRSAAANWLCRARCSKQIDNGDRRHLRGSRAIIGAMHAACCRPRAQT